jgi:hypothetical protein
MAAAACMGLVKDQGEDHEQYAYKTNDNNAIGPVIWIGLYHQETAEVVKNNLAQKCVKVVHSMDTVALDVEHDDSAEAKLFLRQELSRCWPDTP